jgi:hypothetical protein
MAKVSFNKITPIKNLEAKIVNIGENEITIEQYLPITEKADLIERVLNMVVDDTGFLNPIRLDTIFNIELIKAYTNISITEKMMENPAKVYDLLVLNDILSTVLSNIPEEEYEDLFSACSECAEHVVTHMNSFAGMMKTITENYGATKMNTEEIIKTLGDPNQIGLVKDILDKIG